MAVRPIAAWRKTPERLPPRYLVSNPARYKLQESNDYNLNEKKEGVFGASNCCCLSPRIDFPPTPSILAAGEAR